MMTKLLPNERLDDLQIRGYESQRVSDFMGNHGYNCLMVFKEL